jgi:cell volume regulation protein A
MAGSILIILCSLLLISYLFELSTARTKIPSVVVLLAMGWACGQLVIYFGITVPDLSSSLQVIGTVGLILIVLEGALELEFNKGKTKLVVKSIFGSLIPLLILSFSLAYLFNFFSGCGLKLALLNAIPLAVISSAIAIPSARNLNPMNREFITYESSLSDIFGVLIFNFVSLNEGVTSQALLNFSGELGLMLFISLLATLVLSLLLNNISHHIKFFPIILLIILIYAIAKQFHLPALVFILLFGLFLANSEKLKAIHWLSRFKPEKLETEVNKLKELLGEATFMVRSLFFLLFGFLIQTSEVLNLTTLPWAGGIVIGILLIRFLQLKLSGLKTSPMLFIAPRGLITILLFLSIDETKRISLVNPSLIIQVILLSAFIMMLGLMFSKRENA